jgi:hypothetical protein
MSNTNTGGPAFPVEYYDAQLDKRRVMQGMTLRDYFAAKAMQGDLIAGVHPDDFNRCAYRAYQMADAMLKVREA